MTATIDPAARPVRYRFGQAVLDLRAHQLTVAGEVRACPPRVLHLLQLLCESPGTVFGRDALIAALWPGGQVVSDESLSQVIFKLRSVLGDDGERVVTVRGVGVRLDADIAAEVAADVAVAAETPRISRRRLPWLVALAVLLSVAVAVAVVAWRRGDDAAWATARAWGFSPAILHLADASHAQTLTLQQALAADAAGDRPRAMRLLAAVHDSDATTPVPALLLAIWHATAGDRAEARRRVDAATPRVAAANDTTLALHLRLAGDFADGQSAAILASLSAVLDRAPDAWILRYGRAQLLLQREQKAAALADLKRIDVADLSDRRSEDVLADRASLGDVAGAQAVLDALPDAADSVGRGIVAGRLAYSAGDVPAARAAFARTAALAHAQGRADWAVRGLLLAAAMAVEAGDNDDARLKLLDAQSRAREAQDMLTVLDASLMQAQVASLRHDDGDRDAAIANAYDAADRIADAVWRSLVHLVALRLGAPLRAVAPLDDADVAARGMAALVEASVALHAGDKDRALARWIAANDDGVMGSVAFEEAVFVGLALPVAVAPNPPRDPLPKSNFRLVSRVVLARTAPLPVLHPVPRNDRDASKRD